MHDSITAIKNQDSLFYIKYVEIFIAFMIFTFIINISSITHLKDALATLFLLLYLSIGYI